MRPTRGVAIWPGGGVAFRRGRPGRVGGGVRGRITSFSAASRRRLRQVILSHISPRAIGERRLLWITLTARDLYSASVAKSAFRAVLERLRRVFPRGGFGLIWRLEYQRRGAAHLHLLLEAKDTATGLSVSREIVVWWMRCLRDVGVSPAAQLVKFVTTSAGLSLYVSDMSKVEQSDPGADSPGRWWGVAFRDFFVVTLPILLYGYDVYFEFLRLLRKLRRARARRSGRRWRGLGLRSEFWEYSDFGSVIKSISVGLGNSEYLCYNTYKTAVSVAGGLR